MSTFIPSGKNIDRKWFVVDASGKTLAVWRPGLPMY